MKNNYNLKSSARYRKPAFTLAEVLITLGIIGVVAAMTLPALINNIQSRQLIVGWRKSYSDISNAVRMMSINDEREFSSEFERAKAFAKYIHHSKVCDTNRLVEDGCSPINYTIYKLNGTGAGSDISKFAGGASCILVDNGTIICFDMINIIVDVNGYKRPNTIGKDIFTALMDDSMFVVRPAIGWKGNWGPADGHVRMNDSGDGTCNKDNEDLGSGCSAWYLLHDYQDK